MATLESAPREQLQSPSTKQKMAADAVSWHWQERFDVADVEGACRAQVLKVQKHISYAKWLKQKKSKSGQLRPVASNHGDEEVKKIECEQRFFEWVRLKQRQKKQQQKEQGSRDLQRRKGDQPYVKPASLHVNPGRRTEKKKKVQKQQRSTEKPSQEHIAAALAAWERRKKREDRIKLKHEELSRQLQQHAQRLLHLTHWKKKDVVCAYSTNRRSIKHPIDRTYGRFA